MRKNEYIIIIGGLGFIGSNLVDKFIKDTKYNVIAIDCNLKNLDKDKPKSSRLRRLTPSTFLESVDTIKYCINNFNTENNSIKYIIDVTRSNDNVLDYYQSFSTELIKLSVLHGLKLIKTFSSCLFNNDGEYVENITDVNSLCEHSIFTLGTNLSKFYPNFKFVPVIVYDVYNDRPDKQDTSFVNMLITSMLSDSVIDMSKFSRYDTRDFIHINDVLSGLVRISEYSTGNKQIFGLGTGEDTNIFLLASKYSKVKNVNNAILKSNNSKRLPLDEFNNSEIDLKFTNKVYETLDMVASLKKS